MEDFSWASALLFSLAYSFFNLAALFSALNLLFFLTIFLIFPPFENFSKFY
ncbi:unknown; predicted coding region [Mycoplasmopsis pulmonis]|uniref:Uncharacterized protein n=1 Tax=Mycoplasmopsis pulmonis (strain UAB CTIP) TaxID=272635 RepID=Q98QW2_MYCPU|nr:unknown; predicted coding region [Mycoplasmopsis pulmonis]